MGSFRQITLGAFCVGGAFLLGQFLNNYPNPDDIANTLAQGVSSKPEQSETSLLEPGIRLPQSTSIATMSQPIQSSLAKPADRNSGFPDFVSGTQTEGTISSGSSLPPPSQLDAAKISDASQNRRAPLGVATAPMPNLLNRTPTGGIMMPDFSELAAEFKDTPLELPQMQGFGSQSQTSSSQRSNGSVVEPSDRNPVRSNFDPFSRSEPSNSVPPSTVDNRINDALVHQVQSIPTDFSDEDFVPNLNERFHRSPDTDRVQADLNQVKQMPAARSVPSAIPAPLPKTPVATARSTEIPGSQTFSARTPSQWNLDGQSRSNSAAVFESTQPTLARSIPSEMPSRKLSASSQSLHPLTDQDPHLPPPSANRLGDQVRAYQPQSDRPSPNADRAGNDRDTSYRSAKPMIPFGLTEAEKSRIVEIRKPIDRQIKLAADRFTDHITQPGDTLQTLSTKYFGRPDFYLDIYMANQSQLRNPADVPIGMTLKIPVYE